MTAIIVGATLSSTKRLEAQLAQAFSDWAREDVNEYFQEQFTEPIWPYSRETTRRNPGAPIKEAGSPRDIYDYGDLYESGRNSFSISQGGVNVSASWHWDAQNSSGRPYAYYVHEGEGANYGNPRPWTDVFLVGAKFQASSLRRELISRIRSTSMGK